MVEGQPGEPRVVITDKLASYTPAIQKVLPRAEHRRHKGLNNRAEYSHLPTRQRERLMRRFKSPDQAQHFLEPLGPINEYFCPKRHLLGAVTYRRELAQRFEARRAIVAWPPNRTTDQAHRTGGGLWSPADSCFLAVSLTIPPPMSVTRVPCSSTGTYIG